MSDKNPARVDFEKWARRDEWFLEECAMLLLGAEPFNVYYLIWPKPNAKGFDDIYETAKRSVDAGTLKARQVQWPSPRTLAKDRVPRWQFRWKVGPRGLLTWAQEKGYPIPQELEEAVNRFHPEPKDRPQADAELAGIESPRPAGPPQVAAGDGDLTPPKPQKETPGERSARLIARHQELTAARDPHPTKTIADEEGISTRRVQQLMENKPKAR